MLGQIAPRANPRLMTEASSYVALESATTRTVMAADWLPQGSCRSETPNISRPSWSKTCQHNCWPPSSEMTYKGKHPYIHSCACPFQMTLMCILLSCSHEWWSYSLAADHAQHLLTSHLQANCTSSEFKDNNFTNITEARFCVQLISS